MSVELLEKVTLALENNKIPYLVIGGQAVLVHGRARMTNDIDIVIEATLLDADRVKQICESLKLTYLTDNVDSFVKKTLVIPVYDNESKFRVDIIFAFSDFEINAIKRGRKIKVRNREVKFATLEDLVVFKLYAGRVEDISDVKSILLINKEYDREYIINWLRKFDEEGLKLKDKFLEIEKVL